MSKGASNKIVWKCLCAMLLRTLGSLPRYRGPSRDVYLDSHVAGLPRPSASTPRNNKLTLLTLYATQPNFCALWPFIFRSNWLIHWFNKTFVERDRSYFVILVDIYSWYDIQCITNNLFIDQVFMYDVR